MNIFILCTGRCGSVSVIEACDQITNFTCGHETCAGFVGEERFAYPANHIEADNRLSWYLGRLHFKYGADAFYVHLRRDMKKTALSYSKRYSVGIMNAFNSGLLRKKTRSEASRDPLALAEDVCDTMDANIRHFLEDKPKKMVMNLETVREDFIDFWESIGAVGDLEAALSSFSKSHNTSEDFHRQRSVLRRYWRKLKQRVRSFFSLRPRQYEK